MTVVLLCGLGDNWSSGISRKLTFLCANRHDSGYSYVSLGISVKDDDGETAGNPDW